MRMALIDVYLHISTSPDQKAKMSMARMKRSTHKGTYLPVIEHTNEIELSKRSPIRYIKFVVAEHMMEQRHNLKWGNTGITNEMSYSKIQNRKQA